MKARHTAPLGTPSRPAFLGLGMAAVLLCLAASATAQESFDVGDTLLITTTTGETIKCMLVSKNQDGYLVMEEGAVDSRLIAYEWVHMVLVYSSADGSDPGAGDEPDDPTPGLDPGDAVADWSSGAALAALVAPPAHFVIIDPRSAERFPITAKGEILQSAPRQILGKDYDSFQIYDNKGRVYRNDEFWRVVRGGWYDRELIRYKRLDTASKVLLAIALPTLVGGLTYTGVAMGTTFSQPPEDRDYARAFAGLGILAVSVPLFGARGPINLERDQIHGAMYDPDEVYYWAYRYAEGTASTDGAGVFPGLVGVR